MLKCLDELLRVVFYRFLGTIDGRIFKLPYAYEYLFNISLILEFALRKPSQKCRRLLAFDVDCIDCGACLS
jgi:hypothetical protein